MAKMHSIIDTINRVQFRKIESSFMASYGMPLECTDLEGREVHRWCSTECKPHYCRLVRNSRRGSERCRQDRIRCLKCAIETGLPSIRICHAGLTLACVPIMDETLALGGLFFGKCPGQKPTEDFLDRQQERMKGLYYNYSQLFYFLKEMPIVLPETIHEAAEYLLILLYESTQLVPYIPSWKRDKAIQQEKDCASVNPWTTDAIQSAGRQDDLQKLILQIKIGNRTAAREIINGLLGKILLGTPGGLDVMKVKMAELLAILNRAAAESNSPAAALMKRYQDYLIGLMHVETIDELCLWTKRTLDDFAERVYSSYDSKKAEILRQATGYINTNYGKEITQEKVAIVSGMSLSRIAHLFSQELGVSINDYLTQVRINAAKRFLTQTNMNCTEICYQIGYRNLSYFNRVFKHMTGVVPSRWRLENQQKTTLARPRKRIRA